MVKKSSLVPQALRQFKQEVNLSDAIRKKDSRDEEEVHDYHYHKDQQKLISDEEEQDSVRKSEYLRAYFYLVVNENDTYMKDYMQKYSRPNN